MQNEKITRFSPKYHSLCFPGCKKVLISSASLMFRGGGGGKILILIAFNILLLIGLWLARVVRKLFF